MDLCFRIPFRDNPLTLAEELQCAVPGISERQAVDCVRKGLVTTNSRPNKNPDARVRPDSVVRVEDWSVEVSDDEEANTETLARGDDWVVIHKPVGVPGNIDRDDPLHPLLFVADELGVDRMTFTPVWRLPETMGGPMLFGFDEASAERMRDAWRKGNLMVTLRVITPQIDRPQGTLEASETGEIEYSTVQRDKGLNDLQLIPNVGEEVPSDLMGAVRSTLADEGIPAIGDLQNGGYLSEGHMRLAIESLFLDDIGLGHSWSPTDWLPEDRIVPPPEEPDEDIDQIPTVEISQVAMLKLQDGYPWVDFEDCRDSVSDFTPGTRVRFVDPDGAFGPFGLIDGQFRAAYVWGSHADEVLHFDKEVERRVDEAIARRAEFMAAVDSTDIFRMIHGQGDRLPGLFVDRIGPLVRSVITSPCSEAFRERVYNNLWRFDPNTSIIECRLGDEGLALARRLERDEQKPRYRPIESLKEETAFGPLLTREDGLKFWTDPLSERLMWSAYHRPLRNWLQEHVSEPTKWLTVGDVTSPAVVLRSLEAEVDMLWSSPNSTTWLAETIELNGLSDDGLCRLQNPNGPYQGAIVDLTGPAMDSEEEQKKLVKATIDEIVTNGSLIVCRYDQVNADEVGLVEELERRGSPRRLDGPIDIPAVEGLPTLVVEVLSID
jgi:hypothetical protein